MFCEGQPPEEAGASEVKAFLEYLAVRRHVSANTQNQALNVLVFLYGKVLDRKLGELQSYARAKRPRNIPAMLSHAEVIKLLEHLEGIHKMIASLLYGTGMRLLEGLRLRIQDIEFAYHRIHVHQAKGKKRSICAFT